MVKSTGRKVDTKRNKNDIKVGLRSSARQAAKVTGKKIVKVKKMTKAELSKIVPGPLPKIQYNSKTKQNAKKQDKKKLPLIKEKKVAKNSSSIKGYTPAEYQKYKEECKNLKDWSNQKLKDALRNNLQSMSGNKDQLIQKVADGIVLGRIPRCPSCYGGRPAFDFKKGIYDCKGYRDDTDFKNCHKKFTLADLKRDPWTN